MPPTSAVVRRAVPQDAAAFARLMAEPGVYANLMQLPYPTEAQWAARLGSPPPEGSIELRLVAELGGEVVGSLGLHPASDRVRRRHVAMLGISIAGAAQGQGVGSALMAAALDYADRWAQILRIELQVYADNARAIALYRRFGFVHEGTHRAYAMRDGAYVDSLSMARLHPDPPTLPRARVRRGAARAVTGAGPAKAAP
jgi:L-phenylalanine/L-methionine N-acetyltransferase